MDITLVFFIYGLAFFCMGVVMLLEAGRSPMLTQARVLLPLAVFGLVHGSHEWLEMFLDKSDWLIFQNPLLVSWLRLSVLMISFISLAVYSLWVIQGQENISGRSKLLWVLGVVVYAFLIAFMAWLLAPDHIDRLVHVDAVERTMLAVPAAGLAGFALRRQARQVGSQIHSDLGRALSWASWSFFLYAGTQAVIPPVDFLQGNFLNTTSFTAWAGFPVQVVRAVAAVIITISLMRATDIAEKERQRQFMSAQQERLQALEQVRLEMEQREAMRQELLRHTVIAQEEERARIARELHDETSQTLTAFSLHLAALQDAAPECPKVGDRLRQLQSLSRNISEGIYRLIHDLRPAHLDDLGLVAALQYLCEENRKRLGVQAQLNVSGERHRLDPLVETVIFRIAQEALTNVARHAQVDEASIDLRYALEDVRLQVHDQGVGFDLELESSSRWGLAGMRERANSVDAVLNLISSPGKGTLVEVVVPRGDTAGPLPQSGQFL